MSEPQLEPTVMVFILNERTELLLLRRINTWFGEHEFAPPGGLIDADETPKAAAIREVYEETGLAITDLSWLEESTNVHNERVLHNHYFTTRTFTGTAENREPTRHSELGWYPLNKLPTDTMPIARVTVERYLI